MKFTDLLIKIVPLVIDKKEVENTFIKGLSVSNLGLLTEISSNKKRTQAQILESCMKLIAVSLVDKDGNLLMTGNEEISLDYAMEITGQITEVNTPKGK